jgi:hypothetical protein
MGEISKTPEKKVIEVLTEVSNQMVNEVIQLRDLTDYYSFFLSFVMTFNPLLTYILNREDLKFLRNGIYNFRNLMNDILLKKLDIFIKERLSLDNNARLKVRRSILFSPEKIKKLSLPEFVNIMVNTIEPQAQILFAQYLLANFNLSVEYAFWESAKDENVYNRLVSLTNFLNALLNFPALIPDIIDEDDINNFENFLKSVKGKIAEQYSDDVIYREIIKAKGSIYVQTNSGLYVPLNQLPIRKVLLEIKVMYLECQRALAGIKMIYFKEPQYGNKFQSWSKKLKRLINTRKLKTPDYSEKLNVVRFSFGNLKELFVNQKVHSCSNRECIFLKANNLLYIQFPTKISFYISNMEEVEIEDIIHFHRFPLEWILQKGVFAIKNSFFYQHSKYLENKFLILAQNLEFEKLLKETFKELKHETIHLICEKKAIQIPLEFLLVYVIVSNTEDLAKMVGIQQNEALRAIETYLLIQVPKLIKRVLSEAEKIPEPSEKEEQNLENSIRKYQEGTVKTMNKLMTLESVENIRQFVYSVHNILVDKSISMSEKLERICSLQMRFNVNEDKK